MLTRLVFLIVVLTFLSACSRPQLPRDFAFEETGSKTLLVVYQPLKLGLWYEQVDLEHKLFIDKNFHINPRRTEQIVRTGEKLAHDGFFVIEIEPGYYVNSEMISGAGYINCRSKSARVFSVEAGKVNLVSSGYVGKPVPIPNLGGGFESFLKRLKGSLPDSGKGSEIITTSYVEGGDYVSRTGRLGQYRVKMKYDGTKPEGLPRDQKISTVISPIPRDYNATKSQEQLAELKSRLVHYPKINGEPVLVREISRIDFDYTNVPLIAPVCPSGDSFRVLQSG